MLTLYCENSTLTSSWVGRVRSGQCFACDRRVGSSRVGSVGKFGWSVGSQHWSRGHLCCKLDFSVFVPWREKATPYNSQPSRLRFTTCFV